MALAVAGHNTCPGSGASGYRRDDGCGDECPYSREVSGPQAAAPPQASVSLRTIAREWGRIGCVGFGGPPAHITLFRELCVTRRVWLAEDQFERASTQLAIYCAWRLRGTRGAVIGGLGFILPGLVLILALSVLFLAGSPPAWIRGAGMGAGAAVAAVAVRAGLGVAAPIWRRTTDAQRPRILLYALAAGIAAATTGPWLVLVLLACGAIELAWQRQLAAGVTSFHAWPLLAAVSEPGGTGALVWTALKVGALAFGGGFVIVPLMQSDAVGTYHWMTHGQFLNAVALGQVTPGPLTQTVAVVGYAAGGFPAALLAAFVAFLPSFSFAGALSETWQYVVLAAAAIALLALRRSVVLTLLAAGAVGAIAALLGAPIPR